MLYHVEITAKDINAKNPEEWDSFTLKLYSFLRAYIPTKLIYESKESIEDCVQDTVLFILRRLEELKEKIKATNPLDKITFNYEKWVYNRARSYSDYWLRKTVRKRRIEREYIENAIYFMDHEPDFFTPTSVDYNLLERVVDSYKLTKSDSNQLLKVVENMLNNIGFSTTDEYKNIKIDEELPHIHVIAYAVTDEYLYESGE